jgi:hypothetical protein
VVCRHPVEHGFRYVIDLGVTATLRRLRTTVHYQRKLANKKLQADGNTDNDDDPAKDTGTHAPACEGTDLAANGRSNRDEQRGTPVDMSYEHEHDRRDRVRAQREDVLDRV